MDGFRKKTIGTSSTGRLCVHYAKKYFRIRTYPLLYEQDSIQGETFASNHFVIDSKCLFLHLMLFLTLSRARCLAFSPAPASGYFSKNSTIFNRQSIERIDPVREVKFG